MTPETKLAHAAKDHMIERDYIDCDGANSVALAETSLRVQNGI